MLFCQRFVAMFVCGLVVWGASYGCTNASVDDIDEIRQHQMPTTACLAGNDPLGTGACLVAVSVTAAAATQALSAAAGSVALASAALIAAAPAILAVVAVSAAVVGIGIIIYTVNNAPQYYAVGMVPSGIAAPTAVAVPEAPVEVWAKGQWQDAVLANNQWVLQARTLDHGLEVVTTGTLTPSCSPQLYSDLMTQKERACSVAYGCNGSAACEDFPNRIRAANECWAARVKLQQICFGSRVDQGHANQLAEVARSIANCHRLACAQRHRAPCPGCRGGGLNAVPFATEGRVPGCADQRNYCFTSGLFDAVASSETCTRAGETLSGSDDQSGWMCEARSGSQGWTGCFIKSVANSERATNQWQQGYQRIAGEYEIKYGLDARSCWQCQPLADYTHIRQWAPVAAEHCGTPVPPSPQCTNEGAITDSFPKSTGCGGGAATQGQFTECYVNQYAGGVRYQCVQDPSNANNVAWKRDCGCNGF